MSFRRLRYRHRALRRKLRAPASGGVRAPRPNNMDKRRAAHSVNPARAGLEMEVIASGLNLPRSRALEQAGMAYYHTINTANKRNNQINSVSPKYWGTFKEPAFGRNFVLDRKLIWR